MILLVEVIYRRFTVLNNYGLRTYLLCFVNCPMERVCSRMTLDQITQYVHPGGHMKSA